MCGIGGFVNVHPKYRPILSLALALEIDTRGGHGAGFLALRRNGPPVRGRYVGRWGDVSDSFFKQLESSRSTILHSRFATCGTKKLISEVHPFTIERQGKRVLYGVHNGIIYDAEASARKHGRPYTVDSLELFNCLADGELDYIKSNLHGYGTIVWVEANDPTRIRMCRMTEHADLTVTCVKGGRGMAYASTQSILSEALGFAELKDEGFFEPEVGDVWAVSLDGGFSKLETTVALAPEPKVYYSGWASSQYSGRKDYSESGTGWEADIVREAMTDDLWDDYEYEKAYGAARLDPAFDYKVNPTREDLTEIGQAGQGRARQ